MKGDEWSDSVVIIFFLGGFGFGSGSLASRKEAQTDPWWEGWEWDALPSCHPHVSGSVVFVNVDDVKK